MSNPRKIQPLSPEILSQWHPTLNGSINPLDVSYGSNKRFWWLCGKGHEWETTAKARGIGDSCLICSGKRILVGFNDLATTSADIVAEWHPTLNGNLSPFDLTKGSHKQIWWKCKLRHEWQTSVYARTLSKNNCPYCGNKKILKGFNDLATLFPESALEWHPTLNGNLKPDQVGTGINRKQI